MKETLSGLFSQEISKLVVPKEQVVTVYPDWSLERALQVLTRRGYTSVPVIDGEERVEGVISKTHILDLMLTSLDSQFTKLSQYQVREAMDQNHSGILANSVFSFAFDVLINRPYIPIIDMENRFAGILTRKVLMEKVTEHYQQEFLENMNTQSDHSDMSDS
ncbi:CBS domain-containing protein [Kroppenstedtia pulmonis]|uniref:CBS domain-containing protein n=1 Tax=Kroppenstedtia pulmonis TaxID=1380685 RepID=A0A7D4BG22_9BACL|nr:CBS domain-containing protein [Kroppenstedtia pulmonis]QKG83215.1 CBS domain-containing protein [Kroppenstedtia pulmonis]